MKLLLPHYERKQHMISRILGFIDEYYKAFNKPVALRILSAKYAKGCMDIGGFPEMMLALLEEGSIKVYLLRSGAKVIYPGAIEPSVAPIDAIKL